MKATHKRPAQDTPATDRPIAVVLDWTKTGSAGTPAPCVICHQPAICRSPNGKPCHKTCAEAWTAQHQRPTGALGRAA